MRQTLFELSPKAAPPMFGRKRLGTQKSKTKGGRRPTQRKLEFSRGWEPEGPPSWTEKRVAEMAAHRAKLLAERPALPVKTGGPVKIEALVGQRPERRAVQASLWSKEPIQQKMEFAFVQRESFVEDALVQYRSKIRRAEEAYGPRALVQELWWQARRPLRLGPETKAFVARMLQSLEVPQLVSLSFWDYREVWNVLMDIQRQALCSIPRVKEIVLTPPDENYAKILRLSLGLHRMTDEEVLLKVLAWFGSCDVEEEEMDELVDQLWWLIQSRLQESGFLFRDEKYRGATRQYFVRLITGDPLREPKIGLMFRPVKYNRHYRDVLYIRLAKATGLSENMVSGILFPKKGESAEETARQQVLAV